MNNRRNFLKAMGTTLASIPFLGFSEEALLKTSHLINDQIRKSTIDLKTDQEFWSWVQGSFHSNADFINLNNGGVSPQPTIVQEAFKRYNDICNDAPSYYMFRDYRQEIEEVKNKIAAMAGVSSDEIALNRNTTESLDTIANGLPLEAGDEIIVSPFDYPNMKSVWQMREQRDGIKLVWTTWPAPCSDPQQIINAYTEKFTDKTKLVHLTHVVNWTGQILPVKEIADAAHERGIEVLVDGAHSFAHLDFKIPDTGADYFGTSLHKWTCAPFGNGFTYVKKDKINKIWPTFPNEKPQGENINKLENLGTHSVPAKLAISNAIEFHHSIGIERKNARLQELKSYWVDQVKELARVKLYADPAPEHSCALLTFGIEGKSGNEVSSKLFSEFKIHTTPVKIESVDGVRVTPHVYSTLEDLDQLVDAIKALAV